MFKLFAKKYLYVGPEDTLSLVSPDNKGLTVKTLQPLLQWVQQQQNELREDEIIATFIIDKRGRLVVSDRESEHVFCAGGQAVLSAGEMTFTVEKGNLHLLAVSNQSTGYCPQARSWKYVAKALKKLGLNAPKGFTTIFEFRRCHECSNVNLIKDDWYVCAFCDEELSRKWNIA